MTSKILEKLVDLVENEEVDVKVFIKELLVTENDSAQSQCGNSASESVQNPLYFLDTSAAKNIICW